LADIHTTLELSTLDRACLIVPCRDAEEAGRACSILGIEPDAGGLLQDFDAANEDAGQQYIRGAKVMFVGLAKAGTYARMRQIFQVLSGRLRARNYAAHFLVLSHVEGDADELRHIADAAVNGLLVGRYDYGLLKTKNEDEAKPSPSFAVICGGHDLKDTIAIAEAAAASQQSICNLVNLPSSHKTPESLAQWARDSAKAYNYRAEVLDEKALKSGGFDALLAVNRGSEHPARLVVTTYEGSDDPETPLIALVGKGVTFDTGGVSLKSGDSVHLMKSDMGGAAAVLGAVELLARMKAPVRVIACAPCTDNNLGTLSINPGDVIGSYSGKSIEVINTDAEGRLILADALNYVIKTRNPDVVIDLATLTGSVMRALGGHCAGMFTNSDKLAEELVAAGDRAGERVWRLPLWDEYGDDMKSEIADIKNLSDKPAAGAITAAKFLEFFTEEHPAWAHIDIAGVAFKANGVSKGHAATAYGVRLLYELVRAYGKRPT
jgi:leucyl aminopeptidase